MIKSDAQLQKDVLEEIHWDPRVGHIEVGVAAEDGVVTVSGQVDSHAKRTAVIVAAERVAGVRAVADDLRVQLPDHSIRTDTDIAHAVANALRWDIEVPEQDIKARVDAGWVWLDGDVHWAYQRAAAENAVRNLTGVMGISNNLKVRTNAWAPDVKVRIERALKRNATVDASQITVTALDGQVTLRGKVHSWSARADAERAAWSAPGVVSVKDELAVLA